MRVRNGKGEQQSNTKANQKKHTNHTDREWKQPITRLVIHKPSRKKGTTNREKETHLRSQYNMAFQKERSKWEWETEIDMANVNNNQTEKWRKWNVQITQIRKEKGEPTIWPQLPTARPRTNKSWKPPTKSEPNNKPRDLSERERLNPNHKPSNLTVDSPMKDNKNLTPSHQLTIRSQEPSVPDRTRNGSCNPAQNKSEHNN